MRILQKSRLFYGFMGLVFGLSILVTSSVADVVKTPKKNTLAIKDVQRFTHAISQIKTYYVEPVSDSELFENAIRGMLQGLDPHSTFLDKDDFKQLTSSTKGQFGGLGIEVTMKNGVIEVITPIDDTPAFKAGIEPGDLIVRIDKTPSKGMTLLDAVRKMRGKIGSVINLTIIRKGERKPLTVNITRDVIKIKSLKYKMLSDNIGYIRLSHFQMPSSENINNAIGLLKSQSNNKMQGLILDLRNNPGGLLDSAIDVSDSFLDSKKLGRNKRIVYTEGRIPGAHFVADATPGDILNGAPVIVLINSGSASASEIVAGALQDHKRAILIGTTTFGKGSVQTVLPLDGHTGLKLTTALYFTPKGRSIQAKGIKPDIKVEQIIIPRADNADVKVKKLTEANLLGHLKNGNKNIAQIVNKTTVPKDSKDLLHEDYTLFEAMNIMKGLVILHVPQTSR